MSITSALTGLNQDIQNARTAITNKGGTVTANGGSSQLAADIITIPTGGGSSPVISSLNITPTISAQQITAPTGIDGYSPVNVSAVTSSIDTNITAANIKKDVTILGVTGSYEGQSIDKIKYGAGIDNILGNVDSTGTLISANLSFDLDFTGVKKVAVDSLTYAFANNKKINTAIFPDLTEINGGNAMNFCFTESSIETANFPELLRIGTGFRYVFQNSNLEYVYFPKLTTINGGSVISPAGMNHSFRASKIITIEFPELTTLETSNNGFNNAFYNCNQLTTVRFTKLETIPTNSSTLDVNFYYTFQNCTALTDIYFNALKTTSFTGSYTYVFNNMFNNSTGSINGCTVHFPSNLSSKISTLYGYPTFGGNSNYISLAFDLPATS